MQKTLKTRQICFFLIAFMPVTKFFILPSIISQIAFNDMWASVIISILLDFVTLFFIISLMKRTDLTFVKLLKSTFGDRGAKIIYIIYFFYFLLKSIIPIFEQKDYVEHTLYINNPSLLYFIPFFFFSFYLGQKKIRALGRAGDGLFLLTVIAFILLIVLSVHSIDKSAIFPLLKTNPTKILLGSYVSANWFGDVVYLMFFIGEFKFSKKDGLKISISYLIQSLITIIFMLVFYCTFSAIAFRQRFALTEISKFTTVINNTGRLDYVAILLILFSCAFSLSFPLYFASRILNQLFNFKKTWIAPIIVNGLVFLCILFLNEYVYSIQKIILTYFSSMFIALSNVFPIILSIIEVRKTKEKKYEAA